MHRKFNQNSRNVFKMQIEICISPNNKTLNNKETYFGVLPSYKWRKAYNEAQDPESCYEHFGT